MQSSVTIMLLQLRSNTAQTHIFAQIIQILFEMEIANLEVSFTFTKIFQLSDFNLILYFNLFRDFFALLFI